MDAETIETLWHEFAVESDEHLQILEPLLASVQGPRPPAEDIATLFRSFHSLKGLSRAMSLAGMERLAHRAESLLGQVRDGGRPLDDDAVTVLLSAVDALTAARAAAIEQRGDAPVPDALVSRLEALVAAGEAAAAPVAAATAAAPLTASRPATSPLALVGDPEMATYFAELTRPQMGDLGALLRQVLAGDPWDEAAAARLLRDLGHAATVMDFHNLAGLFDDLGRLLPDAGADRAALLRPTADLLRDLRLIDAETGEDTGASQLLDGLAPIIPDLLAAARVALRAARPAPAAWTPGGLAPLATAAQDLALALDILGGHREAARLAYLVDDVCVRAVDGGLEDIDVARPALIQALEALTSPDAESRVLATAEQALRQALIAALGGPHGAAAAEAARAHLVAQGVAEPILALLTPANLREAAEAIARGLTTAHVIDADLNTSREVADAFVAWLADGQCALTNRSRLDGGSNRLEFLVLSRLDGAAVAAALARLDPTTTLLRLLPPNPASGEASTPVAEKRSDEGRRLAVVRVPGETIDLFMAQIGEMVLARSALNMAVEDETGATVRRRMRQILEQARKGGGLPPADLGELQHCLELLDEQLERIGQADQRLHSVLKRVQERALDLRVLPIDTVFSRFPRVVRDLARQTGKSVRLDLGGRDVRIDKGMVELLLDPLMHMVRNSIDHGLEAPEERRRAGKAETGTLRLHAAQRGNRVVIEIADDGAGLDANRIAAKALEKGLLSQRELDGMSPDAIYRLIFRPGFSTAEQVTETSGRGVGMDVVHTNLVSRLGGHIAIASRPGQGTTFTLELPLTAAIQEALLVEGGGLLVALPDRNLVEIQEVEPAAFQVVRGQRAIMLRNSFLPVYPLAELLGRAAGASGRSAEAPVPVAVLATSRGRIGVAVDRLFRRQELYVKDVHPKLTAIPGIGGASVLGDGRVVLILDIDDLLHLASGFDDTPEAPPPVPQDLAQAAE